MTPVSLLDNDFYAFTMGQVVHAQYPHTNVRYKFRNRTFSVPLADCFSLDELGDAIEAIRELTVTEEEIDYLATLGFNSDYLNALRKTKLPEVNFASDNGHLVLEYEGTWHESILWETPILYTISDLYYKRFAATSTEGRRRLNAKLSYLQENPQLRFVEFGTRRRFSRQWQEYVIEQCAEHIPEQLLGTSNVHFARAFGLKPTGTMAHQLFMVTAAMELAAADTEDRTPDLAAAQNGVLHMWEEMYGNDPSMLIMLPDTYGTQFFLNNLDPDLAARWSGIRQDSGDPFVVNSNSINWQAAHGIDPHTQKHFPSDGLDLRTMSLLYDKFGARTQIAFGWGTGLSNDKGMESLSMVVKPDAVLGITADRGDQPCVKLSDNPAKATGPAGEVERYKSLVGYDLETHNWDQPRY